MDNNPPNETNTKTDERVVASFKGIIHMGTRSSKGIIPIPNAVQVGDLPKLKAYLDADAPRKPIVQYNTPEQEHHKFNLRPPSL
jgi:hypothetical protein